ncbi:hypothetical protein B7494_g3838 [Chlorociboria aeruginascens]|nr:hypothetical protein B7494_g3838 [Chlorociboria aeruginascens]
MGKLVKLMGSGIGLASEATAQRNAQSPFRAPQPESSSSAAQRPRYIVDAPPAYVEVSNGRAEESIAQGHGVAANPRDSKGDHKIAPEYGDDDTTSEEGDEEHWDLDDALDEQTSPTEESQRDMNQVVDDFRKSHPPPSYAYSPRPMGRLPCPVILPQRRPRDHTRGFVRAYAPVLEDCGIDQDTFLSFLKSFHQASQASPWLSVINIAAGGAGMAPSAIAAGVGMAVQFAVGVAMEVQARARSNTFLNRMNNEFFRPRGLYCLIMTYKPESTSSHDSVDVSNMITKNNTPESSAMKQQFKNLRLSSGKTFGEIEMPEAAPLIFPALDEIARGTSAEAVKKQNKLKSSQKYIADYFDRRAQATYAAENPDSSLAKIQSGLASRYSDPNHPTNSGSLLPPIMGGSINHRAEKNARKQSKRYKKAVRKAVRKGRPIPPEPEKKKDGIVKRKMKKDILYLMIVNMPSDEELAMGKQFVQAERSY